MDDLIRNMLTLALMHFVLLLIGVTYLVTQSSIFMLPRMLLAKYAPLLGTLIYCPVCTGFWVGLALGLLGQWPLPTLFGPLDAAVASVAIMASWAPMFIQTSSWQLEQEDAPPQEKDREGLRG